MVRKAPAAAKNKGSQKDETRIPGITEGADFIQQMGDVAGIELDKAILRAAREKPAEDIMNIPEGGLKSEISAPVNSE